MRSSCISSCFYPCILFCPEGPQIWRRLLLARTLYPITTFVSATIGIGCTKRFMQEYGKLPASSQCAYIGAYLSALRATTNTRSLAVRRSRRPSRRVPPRLKGLRPSPCGVPPLRPIGLWQGFGTRKPPSRLTKPPATRAARKQPESLPRFSVVIPSDHILRRAHASKKLCFGGQIRRSRTRMGAQISARKRSVIAKATGPTVSWSPRSGRFSAPRRRRS